MYELPYKIKKKCCHVLLWIEHSIIFFCCSKLCYQAFKYHFESCMCHVDFVYKAMISSKEIRRTGNDMKATVRFNVFLNVQNLILKKPNATFPKLLNGFIILCLGFSISHSFFFDFPSSIFSVCMIKYFQCILIRMVFSVLVPITIVTISLETISLVMGSMDASYNVL